MKRQDIHAVLFDFGGVLAEEGFRKGLEAIASLNGLAPQEFFRTAQELILSSGYLTGRSSESSFWDRLRGLTGITGSDSELRAHILERFVLRDWMLALVEGMKATGLRVAVLSDQTNWLDELDAGLHFFRRFERVFNSFHLGKSKHDPSLFQDVLADMGLTPGETLFIDDTLGHVERARSRMLHGIHYTGREPFLAELARFIPDRD
jgi:putative hydrolase of the HAD superfamily